MAAMAAIDPMITDKWVCNHLYVIDGPDWEYL